MQQSPATLVEALHDPACYQHPVARVKLLETHISWVFLAGEYAYKLKKPVNFGFLDFSTLSKRRHFCREELRLNRRFAPQLYLDVVSIGGSAGKPVVGGSPAIDYLVKMKRFARQDELDQLLQQGQLTTGIMESFADNLADIHRQAPAVEPDSYFGSLDSIALPAEENFAQIGPLLPANQRPQLDELASNSQTSLEKLRKLLTQRKEQGFIRECHGDVHLANMVWHNNQPLLFDCIEFNDNFRCIDLVNDYAFLLMDLDDRNAAALGWRFLNRYLRQTGDYQGLRLLNYYKSYRAMVRAKVFGLRLNQSGLSAAERHLDSERFQSYLKLAGSYHQPRKTSLFISHGFSGAGKSTFIEQLAPLCGAVSIHSDVERKRLHGLSATSASRSGLSGGIYTEQTTRRTYDLLESSAETVIRSGIPAIVDATFLQQWQRDQLCRLADRRQVPFIILDFRLSEEELFRRVGQRSAQAAQVSEATTEVLKRQLEQAQPLTPDELQKAIRITPDSSAQSLSSRLAG